MTLRKGVPDDIPAIVDLAVESVSRNPIPVVIDREAMKEQAVGCMGPAHFCWVSEIDGEVVAAVVAMTQPAFWHKRLTCSVLMYYTRVPGEGVKLLRKFTEWVKSRAGIKVAVMELEPETDPRVANIMNRLGFTRVSTNVAYVRGLDDV